MKKLTYIICFLLTGCSVPLVYAPAPAKSLAMQKAVIAKGVLRPQDISFTLISDYQQGRARAVVIGEPAFTWVDMSVTEKEIIFHEKNAQVPNQLALELGKLVQAQFLTACPARSINRPAKKLRGNFELEVTGGVCP